MGQQRWLRQCDFAYRQSIIADWENFIVDHHLDAIVFEGSYRGAHHRRSLAEIETAQSIPRKYQNPDNHLSVNHCSFGNAHFDWWRHCRFCSIACKFLKKTQLHNNDYIISWSCFSHHPWSTISALHGSHNVEINTQEWVWRRWSFPPDKYDWVHKLHPWRFS